MKKKRLVAALILLSAFVLGLVIGSTGTVAYVKTEGRDRSRHHMESMDMREDPFVDHMIHRMERKLDLTEDQVVAIRERMTNTSNAFRELHGQTREELRAIAKAGTESVKEELTPEQAVVFEREFFKMRMKTKKNRINHKHRSDGEHHDRNYFDTPPPPPPEPPQEN